MCISDKLKRGRQLALKLRQEHVTRICNAIEHRFHVVGCACVICTVVQNDTVIAANAHDYSNTSGDSRQLIYLLCIDSVANKRLLEVLSKRVSANRANHVDVRAHSSCSNSLISALSTWASNKVFATNSLALLRHFICLDGDIHVQASKYNHFAHVRSLPCKSAALDVAGQQFGSVLTAMCNALLNVAARRSSRQYVLNKCPVYRVYSNYLTNLVNPTTLRVLEWTDVHFSSDVTLAKHLILRRCFICLVEVAAYV